MSHNHAHSLENTSTESQSLAPSEYEQKQNLARHDYNHGLFKFIFSKMSGSWGKRLNKHRRKIVLGFAAITVAIDTAITNSTLLSPMALLLAGAALAHDASEDIMEVTGGLKDSQRLSSGIVGTAIGFVHTLSEGVFSVFSTLQSNADIGISSVIGSNASHILLMAGGAAVIGTVGAGQSARWKLHALGVAGLTGAFAYQVITGEFIPILGAVMIAGGFSYLYGRVISGETCALHGDACGGGHHANDEFAAQSTRLSLSQRLSDPKVLQLFGSLVALMASAHILGHQVLAQAQNMGISATAAGAVIAALALAAPEMILTWKAAYKNDCEMAWGAITGCTVATVGIVGGGLAMSGASIPISLDITSPEGIIHMAAFVGSALVILSVTHPKVIRLISNDGVSLPKWVGLGFLVLAVIYYMNSM